LTGSDQNSDVYDPLVRLLRPREGAPRLPRPRLRGGRPRRRPRLPRAAERADGRLDGAADPHRRAADRRLHRALAPRPRGPADRAARRVGLARGAVPRAPSRDPDLVDRRAAAVARLAAPPVGEAVVAERRALPADPRLERLPDPAMERANLLRPELRRRPQRVDASAPQRLVGVDVPIVGDRP